MKILALAIAAALLSAPARAQLGAIGYDQEGMGPTEIDGTDAKHPVPYEDGYPTVDDSYNTAHDYAVKCTFPGGIEMIVTSRSDNGILFFTSAARSERS